MKAPNSSSSPAILRHLQRVLIVSFGFWMVSCSDAEFASTKGPAVQPSPKVDDSNAETKAPQTSAAQTDTNVPTDDVRPEDPNKTNPAQPAAPVGAFGQKDDGIKVGLVGNVYVLPRDTLALPDFSKLTASTTLVLDKLDVGDRRFTEGFPSVKDLTEYFGILFNGTLQAQAPGSYEFRILSDDGSKLFINNQLVIDNDGQHSKTAKESTLYLTAGTHAIRVEYFQGPADRIALQLFWKRPGTDAMEIVPASVLSRPAAN